MQVIEGERFMIASGVSRHDGKTAGSRPAFSRACVLVYLVLVTGCSAHGTPFNTTIVRDGDKVYKYKGGVVTCPDGRHFAYHPTDYEKESGLSIPSLCNYRP
jgi:hypothetical protein